MKDRGDEAGAMTLSTDMERAALISDDGLYRYRLSRRWSDDPVMTFVCLNPSTADALSDDPTIRRCMGFARRDGYGAIDVVNLFALRVTRPVHLFDGSITSDPNGPENEYHVKRALLDNKRDGGVVVAAWGALPFKRRQESTAWLQFFSTWTSCENFYVHSLGRTADGSPRHPLYLAADTPLEVWP